MENQYLSTDVLCTSEQTVRAYMLGCCKNKGILTGQQMSGKYAEIDFDERTGIYLYAEIPTVTEMIEMIGETTALPFPLPVPAKDRPGVYKITQHGYEVTCYNETIAWLGAVENALWYAEKRNKTKNNG